MAGMLKNNTIIVFSDDWGRHPSSCQHLVRQLAPGNRILWVNTIGMRRPQFSLYDIKRSLEILFGWLKNGVETQREVLPPNFVVAKPVIIPFNNIKKIRCINNKTICRTLRRIMSEYELCKPIIITTFPCTCDLIGSFDETIHIYYCVDDFVNWPGVDQELIRTMEDELIEKCDLVFTTAMDLSLAKERPSKRNIYLPHGVDFEHFNSAMNSSYKLDGLGDIKKPVVGFMGTLSEWLDYDLIVKLAKARPDWTFLLIGPADTDISCLFKHENIRLIGKVSYEELPRYVACFDVGIIPFLVNDLTRSVNPLKLLEYLSLGLPVVSSFMPEIMRYSDAVMVAKDHGAFLEALESCLFADTLAKRHQRIEIARNQSWSAVASRFSSSVCIAITDKNRGA
jgi:glycosyltransferase involved in cell wall biosynthesis